ncbi:hypothetical protein [Saccharomonospora halophila]|uniref:hypothetical protein n=1 Tax=Saccharomonospora halophila TaxID=129922 RepID=UPI0003651899|nr:hypothetical protein [Saccharomonospora halophila]
MTTVLRWTGIGKLAGFYRHLAFAGPRTTTGIGATLLAGDTAIHVYWLITSQALAPRVNAPTYLIAYFAIHIALTALALVGVVAGHLRSWFLGSLLMTLTILVYVASRTWQLPDMRILVGWWDYALGTFAMILALLFLGLHFTVLTKVCIAYPQQRDWHE